MARNALAWMRVCHANLIDRIPSILSVIGLYPVICLRSLLRSWWLVPCNIMCIDGVPWAP